MNAGPIVNEISASFDLFWNSEWALPVAAVVKERATEEDLRDLRKRLEEKLTAKGYPYPIHEQHAGLRERLVQIRDSFIWAPGKVFVEQPSRVEANAENVIASALRERASQVEHELSIESPYFVLGDATMERVRQLTARGVKVRVLTNSAASHEYFHGVSDAILGEIARFGTVTNYDSAAVVHQLNDPLTSICFVLRGRLKTVRVDSRGDEHLFQMFERGDQYGMKPRPSLHSCRQACVFFTRDNSRLGRSGFHHIWCGDRKSRSMSG